MRSMFFYDCYKTLVWCQVDLNRSMKEVLSELTKYPIKTRLSLSGTLVVARDIAHAKIKERLDSGQGMPDYLKNHPVYYAGPAKTPKVRVFLVMALWSMCIFPFLLRDAMQVWPMLSCGVCVCLSCSNIPSKWINISSKFFHHQLAKPF